MSARMLTGRMLELLKLVSEDGIFTDRYSGETRICRGPRIGDGVGPTVAALVRRGLIQIKTKDMFRSHWELTAAGRVELARATKQSDGAS